MNCISWRKTYFVPVVEVPDDVTSEAAEPLGPAGAAAVEVAAVRPAPQVSLRHLASRDGRLKLVL